MIATPPTMLILGALPAAPDSARLSQDLLGILPELLLVVGLVGVLLSRMAGGRAAAWGPRGFACLPWLGWLVLVNPGGMFPGLLRAADGTDAVETRLLFGGQLQQTEFVDSLRGLMLLGLGLGLVLLGQRASRSITRAGTNPTSDALAKRIHSNDADDSEDEDAEDRAERTVLLLGAGLGLLILLQAAHLLSFILGVEMASLPAYALVAWPRDSRRSAEAGLKVFWIGSTSASFMIYGASWLAVAHGTGSLDDSIRLTA